MKTIILFFLLFAPLQKASIDQAHFHFQKGNQFYEKGQYLEAIKQFEGALQTGYASGTLYFNLGNAYYKSGKIGPAILYYERARRYLPNDEDVEFNLSIANLAVVDKIVIPPQFIIFQWLDQLRNFFSLQQLTWIVIGCYFLLTLFIITRIFYRQDNLKNALKITTIILSIFLIIIGAIFISRLNQNANTIPAIIITEKVTVRSAPESNATEVFALHEGVKVFVLETSAEWSKIRLPDGKIGWLATANLVAI